MSKKLSKQKLNDIITYGIVIAAFIIMQILIMYWCWWMLSATSTVTSCVIPARSKSA